MELPPGPLTVLSIALGLACAVLIVLGYVVATRALLRRSDKRALLNKLYLGSQWPAEAPRWAALLIVAGLLCGLLAVAGFVYIWVSPAGDSGEPPDPGTPRPRSIISVVASARSPSVHLCPEAASSFGLDRSRSRPIDPRYSRAKVRNSDRDWQEDALRSHSA